MKTLVDIEQLYYGSFELLQKVIHEQIVEIRPRPRDQQEKRILELLEAELKAKNLAAILIILTEYNNHPYLESNYDREDSLRKEKSKTFITEKVNKYLDKCVEHSLMTTEKAADIKTRLAKIFGGCTALQYFWKIEEIENLKPYRSKVCKRLKSTSIVEELQLDDSGSLIKIKKVVRVAREAEKPAAPVVAKVPASQSFPSIPPALATIVQQLTPSKPMAAASATGDSELSRRVNSDLSRQHYQCSFLPVTQTSTPGRFVPDLDYYRSCLARDAKELFERNQLAKNTDPKDEAQLALADKKILALHHQILKMDYERHQAVKQSLEVEQLACLCIPIFNRNVPQLQMQLTIGQQLCALSEPISILQSIINDESEIMKILTMQGTPTPAAASIPEPTLAHLLLYAERYKAIKFPPAIKRASGKRKVAAEKDPTAFEPDVSYFEPSATRLHAALDIDSTSADDTYHNFLWSPLPANEPEDLNSWGNDLKIPGL